jgi:hypothetical protein
MGGNPVNPYKYLSHSATTLTAKVTRDFPF